MSPFSGQDAVIAWSSWDATGLLGEVSVLALGAGDETTDCGTPIALATPAVAEHLVVAENGSSVLLFYVVDGALYGASVDETGTIGSPETIAESVIVLNLDLAPSTASGGWYMASVRPDPGAGGANTHLSTLPLDASSMTDVAVFESDGALDSWPRLAIFEDTGALFWFRDGNLHYTRLSSPAVSFEIPNLGGPLRLLRSMLNQLLSF